jgi:hypothetical protein
VTEKEWAECRWTTPMMALRLRTPGLLYKTPIQSHPRGRRKLWLFGVAIARRVMHLIDNPKLLELIVRAEELADGQGKVEQLQQLRRESGVSGLHWIADNGEKWYYRNLLTHPSCQGVAQEAVAVLGWGHAASSVMGANSAALALEGENLERETARQCELVRDIFGNPFRPVTFPKTWRTKDIVGLAQQAYETRDFSTLPVLADALQDAGCEDANILAHCRGPKEGHVRGYWVIDHVLARG